MRVELPPALRVLTPLQRPSHCRLNPAVLNGETPWSTYLNDTIDRVLWYQEDLHHCCI